MNRHYDSEWREQLIWSVRFGREESHPVNYGFDMPS